MDENLVYSPNQFLTHTDWIIPKVMALLYSNLYITCGNMCLLNSWFDPLSSWCTLQHFGQVDFWLISCTCSAVSKSSFSIKNPNFQKAACLQHSTYYLWYSWRVKCWISIFCWCNLALGHFGYGWFWEWFWYLYRM